MTALGEALAAWRGPAYADVTGAAWAERERVRLEELRAEAVELRARALLDRGEGAGLVAELGDHAAAHPWREPAWTLLARALHGADRRADALDTLRRARAMLADRLGLDPGDELRRLETDILGGVVPSGATATTWTGPGVRLGPRTTVDLARTLALAGGDALVRARHDRLAAVRAAERTGDLALTARIIGAYDVPALWSRADDPAQSREVVAAAERTLAALGPDGPADLTARLLATVAVESRSADVSGPERERARDAARRAEAQARDLGDPALLVFALNGVFLQSFTRPGARMNGRHRRRDPRPVHPARAAGLRRARPARTAAVRLGPRRPGRRAHARRGGRAARRHHRGAPRPRPHPLVPDPGRGHPQHRAGRTVRRHGRRAVPGRRRGPADGRDAGAAPRPAPARPAGSAPAARPARSRRPPLDWGPYRPWAEPLLLLDAGRTEEARAALAAAPAPPPDHLQEALWCLTARAAARLGDRTVAARAAAALAPARQEHAGAASGLLTLGPVTSYLAEARDCAGPPA